MGSRACRLSRPLGPWAPSWGGSCRWDGRGLRSRVRAGHCPRMDVLSSQPPWRRGSELGDPRPGPVSSKGGGRCGQDAGWEGGCGSVAGRPSLPSPTPRSSSSSPPSFPSSFSPSPFPQHCSCLPMQTFIRNTILLPPDERICISCPGNPPSFIITFFYGENMEF